MHKNPDTPKGTLHTISVASRALTSNMLGDPTTRKVIVYVPFEHTGSDLPLLVDLVGYTAGGPAHTNWKNFGENVPERLDRLIASGVMDPAVVAFPDCYTRLGGNQYINSIAMGNWEDFLIKDMLPAIENRFLCGGDGKRAVFGKSSGGYGSLIHAMRHSDVWSAAACHSGDMAFEMTYLPEMPQVLRALSSHEGSIEAYINKIETGNSWDGTDIHILMLLAMAATYDPDPGSYLGIRLPVDPWTCELIPELWENWLQWDPLVQFTQSKDNLKTLKGLWIDCGNLDQFDLVYAARRMHRNLEHADIPHIYEEFPDDHFSVDYRMDKSLPYLVNALNDKYL
ncbi:MAG: enterochelin esterase [Cohaesibacteraceae bacterium]|nr:enterochelin esterase [Cohaesibacteraceae bacterium]